MREIDFSRNRISGVSRLDLLGLLDLVRLDLSRNLLTDLRLAEFVGCPRLRRLDVSANRLTSVEGGDEVAERLFELDVSGNQLADIDVLLKETLFADASRLLNATANPLDLRFDCGKSWLAERRSNSSNVYVDPDATSTWLLKTPDGEVGEPLLVPMICFLQFANPRKNCREYEDTIKLIHETCER